MNLFVINDDALFYHPPPGFWRVSRSFDQVLNSDRLKGAFTCFFVFDIYQSFC